MSWIAAGLLVLALVASSLSWWSATTEVANSLAVASFIGVFVVFPFAIVELRRNDREGRRAPVILDDAPTGRFVLAVCCVVVLAAFAIASIGHLGGGVPDADGGRYVLNDHGALTTISRADDLVALGAETRFFAGVAGVFLAVSTVAVGTRARRLERTRPPA